MDEINIQAEQMRKLAEALGERLQPATDGPPLQVLLDALDQQPETVNLSPDIVLQSLRVTALLTAFVADMHARQAENMERIAALAKSLRDLYLRAGEIDTRLAELEKHATR